MFRGQGLGFRICWQQVLCHTVIGFRASVDDSQGQLDLQVKSSLLEFEPGGFLCASLFRCASSAKQLGFRVGPSCTVYLDSSILGFTCTPRTQEVVPGHLARLINDDMT